MVTIQDRVIDFSTFPDSDGEPIAENRANLDQMVLLIYGAERLLAPRVRFAAGGNQFIYYNRRNGREHITPDVYVALDVAPGKRPKWETWNEEDKFPDLVMEITSVSTQDEDVGNKVRLYGRLGAREYYIYDPEQLLQPPFRAYTREGDRLVERPVGPDLRAFSPVLGAELRVVGEWLRIIDPATGEPIPSFDEEHAALHETRTELGETQLALGQTQRRSERRSWFLERRKRRSNRRGWRPRGRFGACCSKSSAAASARSLPASMRTWRGSATWHASKPWSTRR